MSESISKIRNIALAGHGGAGKTSLAEVMLYRTGTIKRFGRVEEGNTAMDFEPEETKRTASLSCGFHQYTTKNCTVSIIDTPGDQNFFSSTKTCLPYADGVVLVIDSISGVEFRTEQALEFAKNSDLATVIFLNKLEHPRSDFQKSIDSTSEYLEPKPILLQLPIGRKEDFKGIVDLISQKAYIYEDGKTKASDIPADMVELVEIERESFIENVVEMDDELMERYLEGEAITNDELLVAIKKGTQEGTLIPVLLGSATENIGIDKLQTFIDECMPSPLERGSFTAFDESDNEIECDPDPDAPFAGYVFNTIIDPYAGRLSLFRVISGTLSGDGNIFNTKKRAKERFTQLLSLAGKEQNSVDRAVPGSIVAVAKLKDTTTGDTLCDESRKVYFTPEEPMPSVISFAVSASQKGDEDKVFTSLGKLLEEDIALKLTRNIETKQILLSGNGLVHIEATVEKLKRKFNVEVSIEKPKVPYKETIKKKIRVQGKHKKQSGGHGQFGDCWVEFQPNTRGAGFEFIDKIVGGAIPKTYIPAVEKGISESSERGVLAGYPMVDFKATLDFGSFHAVDSSEMAFKIAGSQAFKKGMEEAMPVLLEPIMYVEVYAPDDFMGDIMGDLNSRRGRVLGMEGEGRIKTIKANVPLSEVLSYSPDLRSMTGGRGTFIMKESHYDEVPQENTQKIIDAAKAEEE
jgi:elongation factor G